MAINIKFDLTGNPEPPTILLANRSGNILGQLDVDVESIDMSDKFNDASEFSFTLYKYVDDKLTNLWDKVVDFKLVYCKEWDEWFEIRVELDESTETIKDVFCTQLEKSELSQLNLYGIEINTEKDIERDDYKICILYDEKDAGASILNRLLKDKAQHYSIANVDSTIAKIQRSFSFDGTSIDDAFQEISKEIGCVFIYHSYKDENGILRRTISVYDLQQNCNDCGHRGEFTDVCPKCNSTNIKNGYGNDTLIFVTADELAADGIELVTDVDSVKNCFKLEAGDDLMTATIRNCNPNGSDYIWYFSEAMKEDMSKELVERLNSYNDLYKDYYNNHESKLDVNLVNKYNALVEKYKSFYNTKSTCLNCDYEAVFEGDCPKCGNNNILRGKSLQPIPSTIKGYSSLMNAYYNTIDLALYLESALMPSIQMSETSASEQASLLTTSSLSSVAVNTDNVESISPTTADSAVLSMAKIIVKSTYKVEIKSSIYDKSTHIWKGSFVVTNYSDDNDTAESQTIKVVVNNDSETFIKQKIDKALNKEDTDDYSISGLFKKELIISEVNGQKVYSGEFYDELKKYALKPLKNFYDSCDVCLNILIDQGAGDETQKPDLYTQLYVPYYNKSSAISDEIKIRESEVAVINGVYDNTDEDNPILITDGLQTNIEKCQLEIKKALDFEKYLGEKLWLEFCAYRREDTYSNNNYISDGFNNADLFKNALEFIEVAENEIYKSAELQNSISTTLNNLLAIPKFKPLIKSFKVGNWIRVQVDDEIFKLRLLEYNISYSNFENISVEFSDVAKIKNGITDLQSVIKQASSMATSYDSTQRQANKGNNAKDSIDNWTEKGLDSASVRIKNNNNEEVTLGKSGLLCRSYDDVSDTYLPEQFRLTHNIMAYTTDNWNTVSAALGKHDYVYYDANKIKQNDVGYGLTAKFVTAGYINGSQIIGGEIYSQNYNSTTGTYMNLNNGDFSWAGGKIKYDGDALTLDGVVIKWDTTNDIPIDNVSGLDNAIDDLGEAIERAEKDAKDYTDKAEKDAKDHADKQDSALETRLTDAYEEYANSEVGKLDTAVGKYLGLGGGTLIGSTYVISPYIAGGYLNITNTSNNSRVVIDPNNLTGNGYIFQVHNGKEVTVGITPNGNADFKGNIHATSLVLEKNIQIGTGNISGLSSVATSGKYDDLTGKPKIPSSVADLGFETSKIIYKGDITQVTKTDSNGVSYVETTVPSSNGNIITYSTYDAGDYIVFGRSKGTNSDGSNYICVSKEGLLTARNALIYGTIYATDGEFAGHIHAKSLTLEQDVKIGTGNISGLSSVATSGKYDDLTGKPKIPSSVADLGFETSKIIYKGDITQVTKTDSNGINYTQTTVPSSNGTVITYSTYNANDYVVFGRSKGTNSDGSNYICVSKEGLLTARNALIYGTIYATNGEFTGKIISSEGKIAGWTIEDRKLYTPWVWSSETNTYTRKGTGMAAMSYSGDPAFYAGFSGKRGATPWEHNNNMQDGDSDWRACTTFYVTNDGELVAKKGTFGGELSAVSGTFTSLSAGQSTFKSNQVVINASYKNSGGQTINKGSVIIGHSGYVDSAGTLWDDVTIMPNADNVGNIGTPSRSWDMLCVKNGAIHSSDRNCKKDISEMGEKQEKLFSLLNPVKFKFIDSTHDRFHYGYISQEVEDAIVESGLTSKDFAGFCKDIKLDDDGTPMLDKDGNPEYVYSLRYTEFIALNTHMIQKLQLENQKLKERLDSLESALKQFL